MAQVSSTVTAVATTDDTVVTVIAAASMKGTEQHARIVNGGAVAGFFSLDNEITWNYLPAGESVTQYDIPSIHSVKLKRIAAGSNVTGVYANVW